MIYRHFLSKTFRCAVLYALENFNIFWRSSLSLLQAVRSRTLRTCGYTHITYHHTLVLLKYKRSLEWSLTLCGDPLPSSFYPCHVLRNPLSLSLYLRHIMPRVALLSMLLAMVPFVSSVPVELEKRVTHTGKVHYDSMESSYSYLLILAPQGTWFEPGLGNCGQVNTAIDPIIAIPKSLYDQNNGSNCGQVSIFSLIHSRYI